MRLFVTVLVMLLSCAPAFAQEAERLHVRVTSSAGQSVFIDKGSAEGVEADMLVHFLVEVDGSIYGVVRDVSSGSARVEFPAGTNLPTVGTLGEVQAATQPEAEADPPPGAADVEHPPWSRELEGIAPGAPLLAPVYGTPSTDRRPEIRGRIYSRLRFDSTSGNGVDSTYGFGRVGTWLEATNPFGHGGRLVLDANLDVRNADLLNADASDVDVIVNRLSYAVGGETYAPYRVEAGRFYSIYVPELGLVDGVEGALQFQNGVRTGAGAGFLPLPRVDRKSADDFGVHAFVDYRNPTGTLEALLAYQKTWHEGATDRDQFIGRVNARPSDALWLFAFFRVDLYTSGDAFKSEGFELTELFAQARYDPDGPFGGTLSYSRTTWPELLRNEIEVFEPSLIELLLDGIVDRFDVHGWLDLGAEWRVSARANAWRDQDDDGLGGNVAADWFDPRGVRPTLRGELYYVDGKFNDGVGLRVRARDTVGSMGWYAEYELFLYDSFAPVDAGQDVLRHTIRGGLDWRRGHWFYGIEGDVRIEQDLDSFGLGAFVEYRF